MEFRAEMRYLRVSPQKVRLVLDLIKGKRVEIARNTLAFTKKRVAADVAKLLQSAVDNASYLSAEKNLDVDLDQLYVSRAIANEGPRMKRIRPAPQGRAFRYQRRIAHILLVLEERGRAADGAAVGDGPAVPAKRRAPAVKARAGKTAGHKKALSKAGKKKAAAK
jgi:large subunit ribosomal protein L22